MNINNYTFEWVFSFEHLVSASFLCLTGDVTWKRQIRFYQDNLLARLSVLHNKLMSGEYHPRPTKEFSKVERGKLRHISALRIEDRIVQRCFCEFCLCPLMQPRLIYESGATIKNKGTQFVQLRLLKYLHDYSNNFGDDGYAIVMDFHSYFELIDLEILFNKVRKILIDERVFELYKTLAKNSSQRGGLGLGSQISQISALFYMANLDQYIKRTLGCKYYVRCADDAVVICHNRDEARNIFDLIKQFAAKDKFVFNEKKSKIVPLHCGVPFLHRRFYVQKGRSFSIPDQKTSRECIKRIRQICAGVRKGRLSPLLLYQSFQSWVSHLNNDQAQRIIARTRQKCLLIIKQLPAECFNDLSELDRHRVLTLTLSKQRKKTKIAKLNEQPTDPYNLLYYNNKYFKHITDMRKK